MNQSQINQYFKKQTEIYKDDNQKFYVILMNHGSKIDVIKI